MKISLRENDNRLAPNDDLLRRMKVKIRPNRADFFDYIKSGKVLIKLFQKFAEHEAEPRTNAKASAFATPLQNREVPLLDFGQSQYFPNVGKY